MIIPIKGSIIIWQISAIIRFLGFFNTSKKSLYDKLRPKENMIKIMPSGPTVFTNSTIPSLALWTKKNKFQGVFVHFGVAKSQNLGLFA